MDSDSNPIPLVWSIALVFALVLLNGFFVAAEFAIVKMRASRIEALVQEGSFRANIAKTITANLNVYLSACQLGITLTSLGIGWAGEPAIAYWLKPAMSSIGIPEPIIRTVAFIIAFVIITALHITIGEQVPKTYALRRPEPVTLWVAAPLMLFYRLMRPLIRMINGASNWMLKKSGIEPDSAHDSVHTEEEIRDLVKESHKNGLIDKTELALVDNIFTFSETNCRKIMIPRTEMVGLNANASYEENRQIAIEEMHTRYPVCDPDKDHVIGFVHIKDMLKHGQRIDSIRDIVRPILQVPESMPVSALLGLMQKQRTAMAILIDEYGGTAGLVTIEDIMEEIVGEIQDEFDEERPRIEPHSDTTYSVDGMLPISEMNSFFGIDIQSDDYDTIGGWMYAQVEMPPRPNQRITYNGFDIRIEEIDHMRVSRLLVHVPEDEMPLGKQVG